MKKISAFSYFLLMLLFFTALCCQGQQQYIRDFYLDASSRGIDLPQRVVTIEILDIPKANGRIDRMPDGSLRIIIERVFFEYYQNGPQVKRLVYYLLAHELLRAVPGSGIMNANKVYKPMRTRQIDKLFDIESPEKDYEAPQRINLRRTTA